MVIRVYVSGISGNKEVKKRQQRVTMILDSKSIKYDLIDIAEPGKESEKEFMQEHSKTRESKHPLPPQIFNDDQYCGDYEDFDMANELDELEKFLNSASNNSNKNASENGITNGSSEIEKSESFSVKEDLRESTEENLEIVNDNSTEAVSLGNGVENIPVETDSGVENIPIETDNEVENTPIETDNDVENIPIETDNSVENIPTERDNDVENIPIETDSGVENIPIETDQVLDEHESIKNDSDDAKDESEESAEDIATEE